MMNEGMDEYDDDGGVDAAVPPWLLKIADAFFFLFFHLHQSAHVLYQCQGHSPPAHVHVYVPVPAMNHDVTQTPVSQALSDRRVPEPAAR